VYRRAAGLDAVRVGVFSPWEDEVAELRAVVPFDDIREWDGEFSTLVGSRSRDVYDRPVFEDAPHNK